MNPVSVVGVGADGWPSLTEAARSVISAAEVLYGSERQLGLVPPGLGGTRVAWPSPLRPALPGLLQAHAERRRCVLASGDPMLFGIGTTLVELLGQEQVSVVPGVSSVALACARLGWAQESTRVISVVARRPHSVLRWLAPGQRLLVLSADESSPALIAAMITQQGYGASGFSVLSDMGSAAERITTSTANSWNETPAGLNVIAVHCVGGPALAASGLPDEAFFHDGQLTKRDVRAATLARLAPAYGQLLWDVGAGSGSIAIEWLRAGPASRAVAIESNPDRVALIRRNCDALGVPELGIVEGRAPDVLTELPTPDAIFLGGGVSADGMVSRCWNRLQSGGRLVANAVTLESEAVLLQAYADFSGQLTRIAVSSAVPVGGFTGWRPAMPITQWAVVKP